MDAANTYSQNLLAPLTFETPPDPLGTPTFDRARPVSPGFFAGWQAVARTIQVGANGNELVSSGTNTFYKFDGTAYRTRCSTAAAQRFE